MDECDEALVVFTTNFLVMVAMILSLRCNDCDPLSHYKSRHRHANGEVHSNFIVIPSTIITFTAGCRPSMGCQRPDMSSLKLSCDWVRRVEAELVY